MSFQTSMLQQPMRQSRASPTFQQHSLSTFQRQATRHRCWSSLVRQPQLATRSSTSNRSACYTISSLAPTLSAPHRTLGDSPRARVLASTDQLDSSSTATAPVVTSLHSSQEFQDVIEQNPGKLVVLMCKARSCRPCKMFSRKFQRMAEQFQDAIFIDIMGDETNDTRRLMMKLDVKATPTFFLYRDGQVGTTLTGINENNLRSAIIDFGLPSEKDSAPLE